LHPYTLLATGDVLLQERFTAHDAGRLIWRSFARADDVFVNVEAALTARRQAADKLICVRADPALATEFAAAHATVATVANNHTTDYGPEGLFDTMSALGAAGVACTGGGDDLQAALRPALRQGRRRVAFFGLASTLPNGAAAGRGRAGLAPVRVLSSFVIDPVTTDESPGMAPFVTTETFPEDVRAAASAIRAAHRRANVVVVGIHWGVPEGWMAAFQGQLATYQRPLAHALVDAGADVVIGHHPHVLHGVEVYRGRPIFYSLGNLVFHLLSPQHGGGALGRPRPPYASWTTLTDEANRLGAIARLTWAEQSSAPSRIELWPVWLDDLGNPEYATSSRAKAAIERVASASRGFGVRVIPRRLGARMIGVVEV
jgi:poly-gamma-glutamate synthesis protein (capsule biosynthesis protein)